MKEKNELRFRQIHLDFNTPLEINDVGAKFDRKKWQDCLKLAHANSITCFSCCHHGYSYHPTEIGMMHPKLKFNLLREQVDAAHEIGVNVPIYMTVGYNNRIAALEPGWLQINEDGMISQPPFHAAYRLLCLNSTYLDYVCHLTEEAAHFFRDADGIFFDILVQNNCCCPRCIESMRKRGYDPTNIEHRMAFSNEVIEECCRKLNLAARCINPEWPIYHNNTNLLQPGRQPLLKYCSHIELESLPTAAHNYDHYPMLAAYVRTLEPDFLGMTAKFNALWGDYGGFKHPNALRYECSAMLAQGSKCSIGDQLHPSGEMDESSCRLIGEAYKEVEKKEPWCGHVKSAANVALLATNAFQKKNNYDIKSETGVCRLLLEGHIPFDRIDEKHPFDNYKVLILADSLRPDSELRARLQQFIANGGRLILSGTSVLKAENDELAFDLPIQIEGMTTEYPNFVKCAPDIKPDGVDSPIVMYYPSMKMKVSGGKSLGEIYDPYFTRSYLHFCSHIHSPAKTEPSGYDAGILTDNILYFAHPVFELYAAYGQVIFKQYVLNAVHALIDDILQVKTTLPSQGRVTIMEQEAERRYVVHALYANTILRGMSVPPIAPEQTAARPYEVIEDLVPLYDQEFALRLPRKIHRAMLQPQGEEIPFSYDGDVLKLTLKKLLCHQMIVLEY
ncbi:MAG: hypothetical protein J6X55_10740 [Victivallales bacterium]|nr:hypothetical protein [Victivallales bacterium]